MPAAIQKIDEHIRRGTDMWTVPPSQIHIIPGFNSRGIEYEDLDVADLEAFIEANGLRPLPPVRVKLLDGQIYLLVGHRRHKAVANLIARGVDIPGLSCIVDSGRTEAEELAYSIAENNGQPLTPLAEARAFQRLINFLWTQDDIARKVGKSTAHISNRLKLLDITQEVQEAIDNKEISVTDAVEIVRENEKTNIPQADIVEKVVARKRAKKIEKEIIKNAAPAERLKMRVRSEVRSILDDNGLRPVLSYLIEYASIDEILEILGEMQ